MRNFLGPLGELAFLRDYPHFLLAVKSFPAEFVPTWSNLPLYLSAHLSGRDGRVRGAGAK